MPDVPSSPTELAKQAREFIMPALSELENCFEGVSDEQTMKRPEPGEWSALEIVAHLIQNERNNSAFLASLIDGFELTTDGFGTNVTPQVEAMVKAYPSAALMLTALRRSVEEVLAFTALIPDEFASNNKGSYYRFGSGLLQPNLHIGSHTQQVKDALASS